MKLDARAAILFGVFMFLLLFGGMTLVVLAEDGLTILVFFSILILVILGVALWGAFSDSNQNRRR
jgi:hypothetical protein